MDAKVLVVDDNNTILKIIRRYLEDEGISVFTLADSSEVVKMAHDISPDVILLDILMPGLDGFEVCRLLKKDQGVCDIPVIMLTAETDCEDIKKALDSGAIDYIRKPSHKVEVIARIQSAYRIKQYQEKLKEMAIRDGLTGLYNRTFLLGQLENIFIEQVVKAKNISFVMIDIDFFKKVNDSYGHVAGDIVLRKVSEIFHAVVADNGIVGRYGGEEFGIIVPDMPVQDVSEICESIRKYIEDSDFWFGEDKLEITVSIGICSWAASAGAECEKLLKTADEALFLAKKNGRNRVETVLL
jgi:two-component system, cell cycle response regulator